MMAATAVIRGGRVVDGVDHSGEPKDILLDGEWILEIGPPWVDAPQAAATIDATGMLIHPGLVNGHTHGTGNFAKGTADRWSLELLLAAAPWTSGNHTLEDAYLNTLIWTAPLQLDQLSWLFWEQAALDQGSNRDLITHEPQPVSAGDRAWAGFERWPRRDAG